MYVQDVGTAFDSRLRLCCTSVYRHRTLLAPRADFSKDEAIVTRSDRPPGRCECSMYDGGAVQVYSETSIMYVLGLWGMVSSCLKGMQC